ncbi:MAG: methylamine utilization protein [Saccharospirillaceae bacterium]|nr:methylamine utilization protein [Colwellia sp.]NRB77376.1 methylamine utilization protein [Saccharospirillaceae bacterium]
MYVEPEKKSTVIKSVLSDRLIATMDQVNRQFLPHILVVNIDTKIDFPNSDKIKHHVYSFSSAKTFEIKLYRDKSSEPRLFDQVGEVILGCNIHDWMLGYVYVVDTPWFGTTDVQGNINFEVPDGKYTLKTWHPLFQEVDQSFSQIIDITSDSQFTVHVKAAMNPQYSAYEEDDELDDY